MKDQFPLIKLRLSFVTATTVIRDFLLFTIEQVVSHCAESIMRYLTPRFSLRFFLALFALISIVFALAAHQLNHYRLWHSIATSLRELDAAGLAGNKIVIGNSKIFNQLGESTLAEYNNVLAIDSVCANGRVPKHATGWIKLKKLPNLKHLTLCDMHADDSVLTSIGILESVTSLKLVDTAITPKGFGSKVIFPNLRQLVLVGSNIEDEFIESLLVLKYIESIVILDAPITDKAVLSLSRIATLRQVQLGRCRNLTPDALYALESAIEITHIELDDVGVSESAIYAACSLPLLQEVVFEGCTIDGIVDFRASRITTLRLVRCREQNSNALVIWLPTTIENVYFHETLVSHESILAIQRSPNLARLDLKNSAVLTGTSQ